MGVVADEGISPGEDQLVGLHPLTWYRLQRMFTSPVERDDDDCCRVGLPQLEYTLHQRVHGLLTHARLVLKVRIVLEGET